MNADSQIDEAFELFDREANGTLTYNNAKTAIRALAKLGGFPSEEDLRNALGDPKTVKSIDKATFVKVMKDRIKTFSAEGGIVAYLNKKSNFGSNPFDCLDEDKQGSLDYNKTKNILTAMGDKISPAAFDTLLDECGIPKDDRIDHKKLYDAMKAKIMS